jgi:hypothetical protein
MVGVLKSLRIETGANFPIAMSRASAIQHSPEPRSQQITLSALGLGRTSIVEPDSFLFVVGDSEYRCSRFQAVFLSKTVSDLLFADGSTTELVIDDILYPDHDFRCIWSLLQHGTTEVTESNFSTLQKFALRLGCEELDRILFEFSLCGAELNRRNAVSRLLSNSNRFMDIGEQVEFIASRLDEIRSLDRLPLSVLEIILESGSLRIQSEDWLLDFIRGLGDGFENLIRYVRCEFLSGTGVAKFIETVSLERIDSVLWTSICCRLRNNCSAPSDANRFKPLRFPHGLSHFQGILHHLTAKCGGNIHTKGLVAITASSTFSDCGSVETIVDFHKPSAWVSVDVPNSWVMFDFKEANVAIEGYSITSGSSSQWLEAWETEASNDGRSWVSIERRSTQDLEGSNVTQFSECNRPSLRFYRFVRIRQTSLNGSGRSHMEIGNIEFFGRLR